MASLPKYMTLVKTERSQAGMVLHIRFKLRNPRFWWQMIRLAERKYDIPFLLKPGAYFMLIRHAWNMKNGQNDV